MKRLLVSTITIVLLMNFSCISGLDKKQPAENVGKGNGKKPEKVYYIEISDQGRFMVDTVLATYIEKSLDKTRDADLTILQVDTFGGRIDSMEEIRETIKDHILNSDRRIVAYIPDKAISAGAAIVIACSEIIMRKEAHFGDCAPVTSDPEGGLKMLNENDKITAPLRKDFETACKRNGYPYRLGHAMVSQEFATFILYESSKVRILTFEEFKALPQEEREKISKDIPARTEFYFPDNLKKEFASVPGDGKDGKKPAVIDADPEQPVTVVIDEAFTVDNRTFCMLSRSPDSRGDFISLSKVQEEYVIRKFCDMIDSEKKMVELSDEDAYKYHFTKKIVSGKEDLFKYYGINASDVKEITPSTAETAVRWLNSPLVAGLLIMIGIIAIYAELHTPGFGIAGATALICFALYFMFGFLAREPHLLPVILFLLGILLLLLEIFVIPGFGVAGISGILLLILGLLTVRLPEDVYEKGSDVSWSFDMLSEPVMVVFGGLLLGLVGCVIIARFLPEIPLFSSHVVQGPERIESASESGVSASNIKTAINEGDEAVVTTDLRPSGKIEIAGKQVTAVSSGDYISRGSRVRIVKVRGNQIIAEEA